MELDMNDGNFKQANGYFYRAEAEDIGGEIRGTVEFMQKSKTGGSFVPGVIYTLRGPFRSLEQALAAASQEGFDRAMRGDVNFE